MYLMTAVVPNFFITKTCPRNTCIQRFFSEERIEISLEFFFFNIFAQNIDCGRSLQPPPQDGFYEAVLTSTHNLCF